MALDRFVGVEHEYEVFGAGGEKVDFRKLIHSLPIDGKRIDPGDEHAYRTRTGLKITCDGPEAEVATPPTTLGPGFVQSISNWTGQAAHELLDLIDGRVEVTGGSTHISVSIDDDLVNRASGMFTRTFAPALMLLMDAAESPGLLVRPRHGRLEFGGEFVAGRQLSAALALAAGGALVCERAAASFRAKAALPRPVRVKVARAIDRYGWFVARDAFNVDLYEMGRGTKLRGELRGSFTAQECLEDAWAAARAALAPIVGDYDLAAADEIVAGRGHLPLEAGLDTTPPPVGDALRATAGGRAMTDLRTPKFSLAAVVATWDYTVFAVDTDPVIRISVPAATLEGFMDAAATGGHDQEFEEAATAVEGRTLSRFGDASAFGIWRHLEFGTGLAPPERDRAGIPR